MVFRYKATLPVTEKNIDLYPLHFLMQKNFHFRCLFSSNISTIKLLKLKEALSLELITLILLTKDALWDVVCWTPDLVRITGLCC